MAHKTIVVSGIMINDTPLVPCNMQYELEYAMSASDLIITDKPDKITFVVQMSLRCASCNALIAGKNKEVVCQECQRPACEKCVDTWHKEGEEDKEPEELPF